MATFPFFFFLFPIQNFTSCEIFAFFSFLACMATRIYASHPIRIHSLLANFKSCFNEFLSRIYLSCQRTSLIYRTSYMQDEWFQTSKCIHSTTKSIAALPSLLHRKLGVPLFIRTCFCLRLLYGSFISLLCTMTFINMLSFFCYFEYFQFSLYLATYTMDTSFLLSTYECICFAHHLLRVSQLRLRPERQPVHGIARAT